jgi:hypothetical protein
MFWTSSGRYCEGPYKGQDKTCVALDVLDF